MIFVSQKVWATNLQFFINPSRLWPWGGLAPARNAGEFAFTPGITQPFVYTAFIHSTVIQSQRKIGQPWHGLLPWFDKNQRLTVLN